MDERGSHAPLVSRPARLGDDRGRGRPPHRRTRCAWSCAIRTTTSSTGAAGHYTEIDPPTRLAFTWTWDDDPDREQLIEIDFEEADGVTTVTFTHSGLWDEEAVRSHEDGWGACFDNLERALTQARA